MAISYGYGKEQGAGKMMDREQALAVLRGESELRVFVVLEEDRGCGPSVAGVFASLEAAQSCLSGPEGSNCYLYSEQGEVIQ